MLGIPSHISVRLRARVSDFLVDGQWCVPLSFQHVFLTVSQQIQSLDLYSKGDVLGYFNE